MAKITSGKLPLVPGISPVEPADSPEQLTESSFQAAVPVNFLLAEIFLLYIKASRANGKP